MYVNSDYIYIYIYISEEYLCNGHKHYAKIQKIMNEMDWYWINLKDVKVWGVFLQRKSNTIT